MRILYIITGLSTGGAEMALVRLLKHLDRTRFEPMVISLTTKGNLGEQIEHMDIPVVALQLRFSITFPWRFFCLISLIKKFRPQVIHTWLYHADLLGGLAGRLAGVSHICWGIRSATLDMTQVHYNTKITRKICAILSYCIPRCIFLNSQSAREIHQLLGYCATKFQVVPNGFDLQHFTPDSAARTGVRRELGLAGDVPLVGVIARFDPQKNHLGFIEAAKLVHVQRRDIHFLLAGNDISLTNSVLCKAIKRAGLERHMHLLARRDDIPRLIASLDILVSASYGEAFSNVLGEAMSCAVPCVVTDVGDSKDIVNNTGFCVPANNMNLLAEKILKMFYLSQDERHILGLKARQRVREKYEITTVVKQYEKIYDSLLTSVV